MEQQNLQVIKEDNLTRTQVFQKFNEFAKQHIKFYSTENYDFNHLPNRLSGGGDFTYKITVKSTTITLKHKPTGKVDLFYKIELPKFTPVLYKPKGLRY